MAYPCTECGERSVKVTLTGYWCHNCGAGWDFISPDLRNEVG